MAVTWLTGALSFLSQLLKVWTLFRARQAGKEHAELEHAEKENAIKAEQLEIAVNAPTDSDDLVRRVREQGW